MLVMTIKGADELRDLARDLRRAKGTLRSELTKSFKAGGRKILLEVKHNIETNPLRGIRTGRKPSFTEKMPGTHIRQRISRITVLNVRTGSSDPVVSFEVQTDRLEKNARQVPWHIDTGRKFRHPIMGFKKGDARAWRGGAASIGKPWFYRPIREARDTYFMDECDEAITRTVVSIEKG